jgi:hypothetical protein
VLDPKDGLAKEVKQLENAGNVKIKTKPKQQQKTKIMGYTGNNHHAQKYDAAKAYDKNLPALERLHFLENSEHDKHAAKMYGDPAAKMYDDAAPKFNDGLRAASAAGELSGKFEDAVNAAPKMAADLSDIPLQKDMLSNQMGGYAGDASGAQYNAAAPMMEALGKPVAMMKKGMASMCGMKK